MKEKLYELLSQAKNEINLAPGLKELEDIRIKFLGKKGEVTTILKNMKDLSRRKFIRTGLVSFAGLAVAGPGLLKINLPAETTAVDKVKLGNSGLEVSRIALGTGSKGGSNCGSNCGSKSVQTAVQKP